MKEFIFRYGLIRIVTVDFGNVPKEVNDGMGNLVVPCVYFDPLGLGREIVSRRIAGPGPSFYVYQVHVFDALKNRDPLINQYWRHIGFPKQPASTFCFEGKRVEVIEQPMCKNEFPEGYWGLPEE